jgi:spermidine synthase
LVNGTGMTKLTPITKLMAHLPFAFHPGPVKKGLVICMGMGTTFRSMLSWGTDATVVELVPSVPKLFSYFHPDAPQLLATGRAHIVVDDGRRFLERSSEMFDVMAIDPPPPIGAPTSSLLYSLEFYRAVKPHMRPDSILQIWFPGGDARTESSITKAIQQSFPYVRAFDSLEHWGTHYIVSNSPIPDPDIDAVLARMPETAKKDIVEFNADDGSTPKRMFGEVIDEEYDVDQLAGMDPGAPPITDNRAINEYFLVRALSSH